MRFASPLSKLTVPSVAFVLGLVVATAASPVWKHWVMAFAQEEFGTLTYKCDHAMRSHLIAKQRLSAQPTRENVEHLKAMEIGLLDCQDYDLMRKRLIRWGLTDNELSEMSLQAVEERAGTLQEVIRVHEIRY